MVIRRFRIQDVEPGMTLGMPAINNAGRVVLTEGTVLTQKLIDRLQNWNIFTVDIAYSDGQRVPEEIPMMSTVFEKPDSAVQKKFYAAYADTVKAVTAAFEQIRHFKEVPIIKIRELAGTSLQELSHTPGVINLLYMLEGMDDRTVRHSLNVAIIAGVLGRWLGFSAKTLQELILAGLLHDVGKTQIANEIINKDSANLTPNEIKILRNHTIDGYNLLKRSAYRLSFSVLAGVLQHHEGADGKGYPLQLAGKQIHLFAQIIAVADMYETMTNKASQEKHMTPFQAVDTMVRQTFEKLDPFVANVFLNNIRDQFIGNVVRLSDGRAAVVVYLGRVVAERPVVRTQDGEFIDLERIRDLNIVEVI